MNQFVPEKQGVIRSVSNQLAILSKRMEKMYLKLNPVCKFYENSESDVENERFYLFNFEKKRIIDVYYNDAYYKFDFRFNRENPCKAVKTLQSVLLNWTKALRYQIEKLEYNLLDYKYHIIHF